MNNGPLNQLGQEVKVGDIIAITTSSSYYSRSRTRIAKVVRIVKGQEKTVWDYKNNVRVPTGEFYYRTFVRLFEKQRRRDPVTKTLVDDYYYRPYTKEVFGIGSSIPVDASILPIEIMEALDGKK